MRTRIVAQFSVVMGLTVASTVLAAAASAAPELVSVESQAVLSVVNQNQSITTTDSQPSVDTTAPSTYTPSQSSVSNEADKLVSKDFKGAISSDQGPSDTTSASLADSIEDLPEKAVKATISVTAVVLVTPQNSLNLTQIRHTINESYLPNSNFSEVSQSVLSSTVEPIAPISSAPQTPRNPTLPVGSLSFLQQISSMLASTFVPATHLTSGHAYPINLSVVVWTGIALSLVAQLLRRSRQSYATMLARSGYGNAARSDVAYALNTFIAQFRADCFDILLRTSAFCVAVVGYFYHLSSFAVRNVCRLDYPRLKRI